jgi:hypothetical protein
MSEAPSALACNLDAISATQRPRYHKLISRLRCAIQDRSELQDGYCYLLVSNDKTLLEVAEWITMERLCCPFLTFHLEVANKTFSLTIRGRDGVKAILQEAFPNG